MNRFFNGGIYFVILFLIYRELRSYASVNSSSTATNGVRGQPKQAFDWLMNQPYTKLGKPNEYLVEILEENKPKITMDNILKPSAWCSIMTPSTVNLRV